MKNFSYLWCFWLALNFCGFTAHAIDLPTQLTHTELGDVVEILGYPTSGKFLSNPFPLGGHSGFEIGIATEFIDITDLSRLGSGTGDQSTFQYNSISVGKGLFYNVDVFVHFVPFSSSNEVTDYGGILKWNFYQAQFLPFSLSVLAHYNSMNIQDAFVNESLGADFLGGINLSNVALYMGAGRQNARSTFATRLLDTTDSVVHNQTHSGTLVTRGTRLHSFIGIQVSVSTIFLSAQIDRYEQPVYSAKLGLRY